MLSKLQAAKLASDSGVTTHLVKGDETNVLVEIARGARIGTLVRGRKKRRSK